MRTKSSYQILLLGIIYLLPILLIQPTGARAEDEKTEEENNALEELSKSEKEVLEELEENMDEITTVSADFVQEKELLVLERTMTIKGSMALHHPNDIAWHVHQPVRYRMIIRGSELKQWDEDTDRVHELDFDRNPTYGAMFEQLTSWFSGRYANILDQYELEIESREPITLTFTPKSDTMFEEIISSVTIFFHEDARYIEKLIMREVGESRSTIRFKNTSLNEEIDEKMWEPRPD